MTSLLFCTGYVRDAQHWHARYRRWLDFYADGPIDHAKRVVIDDGSPYLPPPAEIDVVADAPSAGRSPRRDVLLHFAQHLGRQSGAAYPGWWRSFFHSLDLARAMGAEKIVHIESDAYVLRPRLAEFLNGLRTGWHVLWIPTYGMPETAIQVICADQFQQFDAFRSDPGNQINERIAEHILPFTDIHKEFIGDRYSEFKRNRGIFRSRKFDRIPLFQRDFFWAPIPPEADFATQVVPRQTVAFCRR